MTLARMRAELGNDEFVLQSRYDARRAAEREIAEKMGG